MQVRKVQILKHPNGNSPNWYLRYWVREPGNERSRRKWVSTRTTIKRDAEEFRRRLEQELGDPKQTLTELTWTSFVEDFLAAKKPRQRPTTHQSYRDCLSAFSTTAKPELLKDVDVTMLETFGNMRLDAGLAPATVNKDLRHVRAALRWAFRKKYINEVPAFTEVFIRVDKQIPTVIPEADFGAMVRAASLPTTTLVHRSADWWNLFLYLAYYLGLRRGEMIGLTWDSVCLERRQVTVVAPASKGRKNRVLPLQPELVELLKNWQAKQPPASKQPEVLPWPFDGYRQFYQDWHAIQKAAGIKDGEHYVPKNCRSSCASELIRAGVPTVVVKDFLGHANVATTENYYIDTRPAMRSAADSRPVKVIHPDGVD